MAHDLTYREHRPAAPLRPFVQCFWELEGPCDETAPQLIVPDGFMSLVLSFGGPLEQFVGPDVVVPRPRTLLIGEVRRPIALKSHGAVELLGVRFWPGAIKSFIDAAITRIVDNITDETPLDRTLSRALVRTVSGADRADRMDLLQAALANHVKDVAAGNDLVRAVAQALVSRDGGVRIDALATQFAVSRRLLERKFAREVGITPKDLANVLRFRRALRATTKRALDWAEIAVDCGYYDQSHLIRDFKRFTGRTPEAYRAEDRALPTLQTESARLAG